MRTIVGLAIVIAVIWGLAWILRQVKVRARPADVRAAGLASVAALTLGSGRSVHLVRAGSDYVLLGSAEHGVVPIHRYTEEQARDAGLLPAEVGPAPSRGRACARDRRRAASDPMRMPRRPRDSSSACANGRCGVERHSTNAVQILLLIGGLTLVPAVLFTVTGFSRILIVLGFIRTAVGTTNAPPNQVLVGIALFLTIFVMAPTISAIKKDAIEPLAEHRSARPPRSSAPRNRCANSCSARRARRTSRCS